MKCPICSGESRFDIEVFDDRFGYPGKQSYYKCSDCGHVFLKHSFTENDIGSLYSQYYSREGFSLDSFQANPEVSWFKSLLIGLKSATYTWIPANVSVLDIGCGLGQAVAYHRNRGCEAYGIDADENVNRVKDKYGLNLVHGVFNSSFFSDKKFDYITMDQVLEHAIDPAAFLKDMGKVMKSEASCLVAFPNVEGVWRKILGPKWMNWHAPYHLHLYSKKSFKKLCEYAGFKVNKRKIVTHGAWINFQVNHVIFYPEVGEKHSFWSGSFKLDSKFKRRLFRLNNLFLKYGVYYVVSRIVDMLGIGDNVVYEIKKI